MLALTALGLLLTALGVVIAALALLNDLSVSGVGADGNADAVAEATAARTDPFTTTPEPPASAPAATEPASAELSVGACLAADSSLVPCDAEHASEVYSIGDCTATSLVTYMGGVPHLDVPRADVALSTLASDACSAGLVDSILPRASLEGAFSSDEAERWRRCFDRQSARDVDCSLDHTGEYVWDQERSTPDPVDCPAQASTYVDRSIEAFSRYLEVEDLSTADRALCRVSVKGSNILLGSVRNLGTRQLPLGAR